MKRHIGWNARDTGSGHRGVLAVLAGTRRHDDMRRDAPHRVCRVPLGLRRAWLPTVFVGLLFAGTASAQSPSLRDGAIRDWNSQRDMLVKISMALPEDKFGYRATPAQRTWGEQILHIAQANVNQMGRLGAKAPAPTIDMTLTAPADIMKALTASFDYGTAVLEEQTDATLVQGAVNTRFDQFMGPSAKIRVVYYVIGHTWDIYGQMVVYLRLNGITPPASQRF